MTAHLLIEWIAKKKKKKKKHSLFFFVLPEMNRCIIKRWPHHTKYGRLRVGSGEGGVNTVKGEATKKKRHSLYVKGVGDESTKIK